MSPDKLVDEKDPSTWVAKTKVAPVKFTKWFLFWNEIDAKARLGLKIANNVIYAL